MCPLSLHLHIHWKYYHGHRTDLENFQKLIMRHSNLPGDIEGQGYDVAAQHRLSGDLFLQQVNPLHAVVCKIDYGVASL